MYLTRYDLRKIKGAFQKQLDAGKSFDEMRVPINGCELYTIGDNIFVLKDQNMYFDGKPTKKERHNKTYIHMDNELQIRVFDVDDIQFTIEGVEDYVLGSDIIYLDI